MKKYNFNSLNFSDDVYDVSIKLHDHVNKDFNTFQVTIDETVDIDGVPYVKKIYSHSLTNGETKPHHDNIYDGEAVWQMLSEKYNVLIETFYTTFAK